MRYKALPANADIDSETALLQAAKALDSAALCAEAENDAKGLVEAAKGWMDMSEAIARFTSQITGHHESESSEFRTGFQAVEIVAKGEDND